MNTSPEFNVADWIARNTIGGTLVTAEALRAVSNFTVMWNLFESGLCDANASVTAFKRAIGRNRSGSFSDASARTLQECLVFWRGRYRSTDGFLHAFEQLNFRRGDHRDRVEAVLAGTVADPKEELLALMIITYRLRNNLFHGLKSLEMLNRQVENLTNATRCMAAILEVLPSDVVTRQRGKID